MYIKAPNQPGVTYEDFMHLYGSANIIQQLALSLYGFRIYDDKTDGLSGSFRSLYHRNVIRIDIYENNYRRILRYK